ncbi:MAG TPA: hypothetical protein VHI52_06775, partial [Verrucomicrobiae bacterium]|nr:hypothetical protein [Verrucomicrobiae bacterium]
MDKSEEYWRFAESEKHFNEIQSGIRNIASGWMLAAFGAIAFLLKSDGQGGWVVAPTILIAVVSCMATLGLLVLWINDQVVYERLLNSDFLVAVKREFDDATLPPVGLMMLYSRAGKGMSPWMTLFYVVPILAFCGVTVASIMLSVAMGDAIEGGYWTAGLRVQV